MDYQKEYQKWEEVLLDLLNDKIDFKFNKTTKTTFIHGFDYGLVCTSNKFNVTNHGIVYTSGKFTGVKLLELIINRLRTLKVLKDNYPNGLNCYSNKEENKTK